MKKWLPLLLAVLLVMLVSAAVAETSDVTKNAVGRWTTNDYCDAPSELYADVDGTTVKLRWSSYYLDDGYVIKEKIDDTWYQLATTTGTSFTFTNVTPGTHRFGVATYWFSPDDVQSWNIRFVDVTVKASDKVGKPKITLEQTGTKKVKISWKKTTNATSYIVYRATSKTGTYKKIKTLKKTAYTDTVPKTNKKYYYKVVAKGKVNGKTKKATSAIKSIKVIKNWKKAGKYRAVLIGNTYPGTSSELPGPDTDAYGMKAMLNGMSSMTVTTKINATASTMLSTISSAFSSATSKDISIFYYSGHGVQDYYGEYHGALCGTQNTYVRPSELRAALDKIPGKKVVLIDACHSGQMVGKEKAEVTKAQLDAFNEAFIREFAGASKSSSNLADDGYYVITAAHSSESSLSVVSGGEWVGLFTIALLDGCGYDEVGGYATGNYKADDDGNGQFTIKEVYDYIVEYIDENRPGSQSTQYWWPSGGSTQVIWKR